MPAYSRLLSGKNPLWVRLAVTSESGGNPPAGPGKTSHMDGSRGEAERVARGAAGGAEEEPRSSVQQVSACRASPAHPGRRFILGVDERATPAACDAAGKALSLPLSRPRARAHAHTHTYVNRPPLSKKNRFNAQCVKQSEGISSGVGMKPKIVLTAMFELLVQNKQSQLILI